MPVAKRITRELLNRLNTGFKAIFNNAFTAAKPTWDQVAEKVNSSTSIETYAWLGAIPGMREWIGERFIKRLTEDAYTLKNKLFEATVAVKRTAIEDDQHGTYSMAIKGMASSAALHPDQLVYTALKEGNTHLCFDGQNFFDTDHPVLVDGEETSVSNFQAGGGAAWFLLATNMAVKPLIYQDRVSAELEIHTDPNNMHVFMQDEHIYGARSRGAAGYAYWQMAFMSKDALTAANYEAAVTAMTSQLNDEGQPLNIVPNLLVVPPSLKSAANKIVKAEKVDGGNTNTNAGTADILMTPYVI